MGGAGMHASGKMRLARDASSWMQLRRRVHDASLDSAMQFVLINSKNIHSQYVMGEIDIQVQKLH